jgi:chromosome transmission fidelity protein 1
MLSLLACFRFSQKSRISQKLLGFVNHTNLTGNTEKVENDQSKAFMSRHISALSIVETFLERLTCTSKEGKVIVEWPNGDVPSNGGSNQALFRFVQIHSASLLDTMVEEAHAIILAGGTLR